MAKKKRNPGWCGPTRPILEPNAAAIDVGAREMYVAVPPDRDPEPVRVFATFTHDLQALVLMAQAMSNHDRCDGVNWCVLDTVCSKCWKMRASKRVW